MAASKSPERVFTRVGTVWNWTSFYAMVCFSERAKRCMGREGQWITCSVQKAKTSSKTCSFLWPVVWTLLYI